MYALIVRAAFEAAHDIPGHKGKCARLHGHSYRLEAEFIGTKLNEIGMLQDFTDLKAALNEFLPDHTYLNEIIDGPTTAENISRWVYEQLRSRNLPIAAVTVWETENNGCRYTADEVSK